MNWRLIIPICFVLAALWGCASVPTGPSISVMPAQGSPSRCSRVTMLSAGNGLSSKSGRVSERYDQ